MKSVVHHLRKVFENIVKLHFDHSENVDAMISAEGINNIVHKYSF